MELPGAQNDNQNEDILELIDECREQDKLIKIKADAPDKSDSDHQDVYATKLYDDVDGEGETFLLYVTGLTFKREKFATEKALHDFMMDQYEAEIVDIGDIEDDSVKTSLNKFMLRENPLEEVHVFVKHTEDGRYKDKWQYRRGPDEETIRENESLPRPDSGEDFVYYHLGSFQEVKDNAEELGEQHDFDFRKDWRGFIPLDLRTLTDLEEREEVRQIIGGENPQ
mgnify:CR=1 FL=1